MSLSAEPSSEPAPVNSGNAHPPASRASPLAAGLALVLVGAAGYSGLGSQGSVPARDGTPRRRIGARDAGCPRPARSRLHPRRFREELEALAAPQITITEPPAKGDVTFVPGQATTIQYSPQGTCIGQKTQGTGIYYTARAGKEGADRFSIAAKLTTGETATRTFEVRIAE